jgi:arginyl-tRNA synthetase
MRFIMLTRRSDQALEFDYAKVTEKSRENPVFYVQYAHARACSVFRQEDLPNREGDTGLLVHPAELRLIRHLSSWPKLVTGAARLHEPHRIAFYLMELAALFHALWNAGRDEPALKFVQPDNPAISCARLELVRATRQVLAIGLGLMAIEPKEKM